MSTHFYPKRPDGLHGPLKRLLAPGLAAALLLGLPAGILADILAQDAAAATEEGSRGLTHMRNAAPDQGAVVLPSFGADPFAVETQEADTHEAGPSDVETQGTDLLNDAGPDAAAPLAENAREQDRAADEGVPNFGALPDIARADQAREEQERAERQARAEREREREAARRERAERDGTDRDAQGQDARARELASRSDRGRDAGLASERPKKGDSLAIPEGAAQSRNTSFLAGCWRSETALTRTGTNIPLQIEYCFDENGNGRRIHIEDKTQCEGPVTAAFKGRTLVIEGGAIPCSDGTHYVPTTVECNESDGRTYCRGKEEKSEGGIHMWDARFRKIS